jgi:hypothetical protein
MVLARRERSRKGVSFLKDAFRVALLSNRTRGTDATGVAWMGRERWGLRKRAEAADLYLRNGGDKYVDSIPDDVVAILGHTRWATLGNPADNRNNHPIRCGSVIGTHNGVIHNHLGVTGTYGLRREAEVDSEVIFRLAETFTGEDGLDVERFLDSLRDVRGNLTVAFFDTVHPDRVYVLKGDRPLYGAWHTRLRAFAYSSTGEGIRRGCVGEAWEMVDLTDATLYEFRVGVELGVTAHHAPHGTRSSASSYFRFGAKADPYATDSETDDWLNATDEWLNYDAVMAELSRRAVEDER